MAIVKARITHISSAIDIDIVIWGKLTKAATIGQKASDSDSHH